MEDNPNKVCIKGTCVAIAIFLAVISGLGYVVHCSLQAEQQRTEQKRIKKEADDARIAELNEQHAAYERLAYLRKSAALTDGVAGRAGREVINELRAKYGDTYELTAVDYYEIHKARMLARVCTHISDLDAIKLVELEAYNENRMIIGLPPVTAKELYK